MSTTRKILTAALVAVTVAAGSLAASGSAEAKPWHHHHNGWGWGAGGLAAGLVIGSALASRPAYAESYVEPVRRCTLVERVNRWGEVIGTRRVCTYE